MKRSPVLLAPVVLWLVGIFASVAIAVVDAQPVSENSTSLDPAAISGKVTDALGVPVMTATVSLYKPGNPFPVEYAYSDISGDYSFSGLNGGRYKLYFDPGFYSDLIPEYFNNKSSLGTADILELGSTDIVTGIDASLDARGKIGGAVLTSSGDPAVNVTVHAIKKGSQYPYISVVTDLQGNYMVSGLPQAEYRVYFDGSSSEQNVLDEYYNNKPSFNSADLLAVTNNSVFTSVDAVLSSGAVIQGKMRGINDRPLSYPSVTLFSGTSDTFVATKYPAASGDLEFNKLSAGSYKLYFQSYGGYASEWYDNEQSSSSADPITLASGEVVVLFDAVLDELGEIRGNIHAFDGPAVQSAYVTAYRFDTGYFAASAYSNASGDYVLNDLSAGGYKLHFNPIYTGKPLSSEYYSDKYSLTSADEIIVTNNFVTASIDATLDAAGAITGTVRGGDGSAVPYSYVYLYKADDSTWYYRYSYTGLSGEFIIDRLEPGEYKMHISPGYYGESWAEEWFEDKLSFASADTIALTPGNMSGSIDVTLDALGSITGHVADEQGLPVPFTYVSVQCGGLDLIGCAYNYTDASGDFRINGLYDGEYLVHFAPPYDRTELMPEYYLDAEDVEQAQWVDVTRGRTTGSIDATLDVAGAIEGVVADMYGSPISYYSVIEVYPASGDSSAIGNTYTGSDGSYHLGGLRTGDYKVHFDPGYLGDNWRDEWYSGQSDREMADIISVSQGSVTSSIDAAFVCVICKDAYEPDDDPSNASAATPDATPQSRSHFPIGESDWAKFAASADMRYRVTVQSNSEQSGFYPLLYLYDGSAQIVLDRSTTYEQRKASVSYTATEDSELLIKVQSQSYYAAASYDLRIESLGTISGNVRTSTGDPLQNVIVEFHRASDGKLIDDVRTNASGDYVSPYLASGSYKVFFDARSGHLDEWFDDQPEEAVANEVTVGGNQEITSIDAVIYEPLSVIVDLLPASPDALRGYYRTIPRIAMLPSRPADIYYRWSTSESFVRYRSVITATEGVHLIEYFAEDETGFRSPVSSKQFKVDTSTPIDPRVRSTTHIPRVWSSDKYIEMELSGASDPTGILFGYSYLFNEDRPATPDATMDVTSAAESFISGPLSSGKWYFTLVTLDLAGNMSRGVWAGPYFIERNAPETWIIKRPGATVDSTKAAFSWAGSDDITKADDLLFSNAIFDADNGDKPQWSDPTASVNRTYTGLSNGRYVFAVRAHDSLGNIDPHPAFDTFKVRYRERFEEDDSNLTLTDGCWASISDARFSAGEAVHAQDKLCAATFVFTGTRVDIVSMRGPQLGTAKVYIDSVLVRTIDLFANKKTYELTVFTRKGLSQGGHVVRVEATGRKNASSSGTNIVLDAFDVSG